MNTHTHGTIVVGYPGSYQREISNVVDVIVGLLKKNRNLDLALELILACEKMREAGQLIGLSKQRMHKDFLEANMEAKKILLDGEV